MHEGRFFPPRQRQESRHGCLRELGDRGLPSCLLQYLAHLGQWQD